MATRRICEYLDGNRIRYAVITHSPAYTASQVAQSTHIPGKYLAKVVVVDVDGRLALAVVPSTAEVDMRRLQIETGAHNTRLADDAEFKHRFEGCKLGVVPPFGNLFGVATYFDRSLASQPQLAFNAGTHTDVIVMDVADYLRLARPDVVEIAGEPIDSNFYAAQF